MSRGPAGGQMDTRLARLLSGTPNAQFNDAVWNPAITPGTVVGFNPISGQFVAADPNSSLFPLGVRGNSNNLIMEGLFESDTPSFSVDYLYADKTNPGSLTNTANEWFIGRAISTTQLLVNMSPIPQDPDEFIPPVAFPASLLAASVQPGQPVTWFAANSQFELADPSDPDRLPVGIRGNNNNVIQSGKYQALSGTPFVSGTSYYAGAGAFAGSLVTDVNDWYMGQGIDTTTLLVNANAVAIPSTWEVEHHSATGRHEFGRGDTATRDATISVPESGNIWYNTDGSIDIYDGIEWAKNFTAFTGQIVQAAFSPVSPPEGWLDCDGAEVSRDTYDALFAVIGTTFNVGGESSENFRLPDLRGKFVAGFDSGNTNYDTIGEEGGEETHVLTASEIPDIDSTTTGLTVNNGTDLQHLDTGGDPTPTAPQTHGHGVTDPGHTHTKSGLGDAHENRPPYVVLGYLIKT
jgi:microcystin-dependent protein